jgi:hypothetical protein
LSYGSTPGVERLKELKDFDQLQRQTGLFSFLCIIKASVEKDLSVAIDIVKIFAVFYGLIGVSILVYGIISVFTRGTRIFKDDDSSYGFSKKLTIINSLVNRSISPFIYHRIIPKDSEELTGGPAILMGLIYIAIGLFMLFPLAWIYWKLK